MLELVPFQSNGFGNTEPHPSLSSTTGFGPFRDRRVQVVLIFLEQNSHCRIAIGEIADALKLSPGRLAHLFKSEVGVSLQQYLTHVRLAKAQQQLETTFLSIKEIAAAAGFPSVTRFGASFKQALGITPSQYRKKLEVSRSLRRKDSFVARSANK